MKQLSNRMARHRSDAKRLRKSRLYETMRNNGISNYSIILVESFNCKNKEELRQREDYYIQLLKPRLNINFAIRNEEKRKDNMKKYRQTEKGKASLKKYRQTEKRKVVIKKYQQTDKCKEYQKNYYQHIAKPRRQKKKIKDAWTRDKLLFEELCLKIDQLL